MTPRDVAGLAKAAAVNWVHDYAQIFLFGAEFTWGYSHRFGSRRRQA